jgi:hypothetical protein
VTFNNLLKESINSSTESKTFFFAVPSGLVQRLIKHISYNTAMLLSCAALDTLQAGTVQHLAKTPGTGNPRYWKKTL